MRTIRNRVLIKSALQTLDIDQLRIVSKKGSGRDKIIAKRLLREIEPQPSEKKDRRKLVGTLGNILGVGVKLKIKKRA